MNTTTEILTVDGVTLNTLAKNVEELAGRLHVPDKKGANIPIPGAVGELYVSGKMDGANTIVLPMWVRGCDDDGLVPSVGQDRINFFHNLDQLTGIFLKNTGLLDVRHTLPDGSIRQCWAEVISAIDFSTTGRRPLAKFSVEMTVPDAYWQDVNAAAGAAMVVAANPQDLHFVHLDNASAPIYDSIITVTGPYNANWALTDIQSSEFVVVAQPIPAGQTAVIDSSNWTATINGADVITSTTNSHDYMLPLTPNALGEVWVRASGTGFTAATTVRVNARRKYRVG